VRNIEADNDVVYVEKEARESSGRALISASARLQD
jgi:hypothetical protein